jgi:hypothetical protein
MGVRRGSVTELCYAAEGLSGTAAASSLRRLGGLMDQAPTGRLFSAIATLTDLSAKAAKALEDGSKALSSGHETEAAAQLSSALTHMDGMTSEASGAEAKPRRRSKNRAAG